MPICRYCKNSFPNRMLIDGKYRTLNSRKYCLDCSPYGQHNTRPLHQQAKSGNDPKEIVACEDCGKVYEYDKKRRKGHGRTRCGSCYVNKRRFERKKRAIAYKGGECQNCGYKKCENALIFHHINPAEKSFSISGNHARAWKVVQTELDKCLLLCSNCHAEVHAATQ